MQAQIKTVRDTAELAIVRKIADQIWPATFAAILSPDQIVYMMQMMYAPEVMAAELAGGRVFEVLYLDGQPAGYVSFERYPDAPATVKLHKLYLLKQFHGLGWGSYLLKHVMRQTKALDCRCLRLNVNKNNHAAIKAYLRNGFITVESVKIDIGNGFVMDDFVMQVEVDQ